VVELKAALVAAGYTCASWVQDNQPNFSRGPLFCVVRHVPQVRRVTHLFRSEHL